VIRVIVCVFSAVCILCGFLWCFIRGVFPWGDTLCLLCGLRVILLFSLVDAAVVSSGFFSVVLSRCFRYLVYPLVLSS